MNNESRSTQSNVRIYSRMDTGPRAIQQDRCAYRVSGNRMLVVLADGMGGHDDGEKAALTAVNAFIDAFMRPGSSERLITEVLSSGLDAADRNMKADPASNMGATVVAVILEEADRHRLAYTWVGDSRFYLITKNSARPNTSAIRAATDENSGATLWVMTRDDSLIWDLYERGEISLDDVSRHPMKNRIRHSLFSRGGVFPRRVEEARLDPGDRMLLCTDGVWESFLSQQEMLRYGNVAVEESHRALSAYLDAAVRSGLCMDNNTYLLVDLLAGELSAPKQRFYSGGCAQ